MVNEKDSSMDTGRLKNVTVVKPIVFGNSALYFGKKREEDGHTHQWTLYLKPYENEDISRWIKKVHFKLHDSYANSNRILTEPPYEVTETGWGEFEATIRIYFDDANERPVVFYHVLKLFLNDPLVMAGQKPLVSEFYDEIIFQDPSPQLHRLLINPSPLVQGAYRHETDFESKKTDTLERLMNARTEIRNEIQEMKECLTEAKDLIQVFHSKMVQAGGTLPDDG